MRYCSIDIETTCLNPEIGQILQVGAVIENTVTVRPLEELPTFSCIVEHPFYTGQAFALNMNNWIMKILASLETKDREKRNEIRRVYNILGPGMVPKAFQVWLNAHGFSQTEESSSGQTVIDVAGKNFATFDKLFLEKLPGWSSRVQFTQRIIDPAILFMNWKEDVHLPNLNECMRRGKVAGEVTHYAVKDALDVIKVIRGITNDYERVLY